jgi:hypothetical protein
VSDLPHTLPDVRPRGRAGYEPDLTYYLPYTCGGPLPYRRPRLPYRDTAATRRRAMSAPAELPYTLPSPPFGARDIGCPALQAYPRAPCPRRQALPTGPFLSSPLPASHTPAYPAQPAPSDQDRICRPTLHTPRGGHSRPRRGTSQYHLRGSSSPPSSSEPTRAEARRIV